MAPSATDVPTRYDLILNGQGYLFNDAVETSLPFRTQRAIYSVSPTFVQRTNVSGNFGDSQQDWWLTATQNDWSEGSEQRFFRQSDASSASSFWRSSALDITIPGQLSLLPDIRSIDFGIGITPSNACRTGGTISAMFAASNTNLYEVATDGTITDRGAHGAGNLTGYGLAPDLSTSRIFIGGQTKIRKYDTGAHTFADFSATPASSVCYLNNSLFGMSSDGSRLNRFDTGGVATPEYTWQDATGVATGTQTPIAAFGGKLLILRLANDSGAELWLFDGVGTNRLAAFPDNFLGWGITVINGIAFVSGALVTENATKYQSAVYYYTNGNIGLLWRAKDPSTNLSYPAISQFHGRLVIADETEGRFLFYDPAAGAFFSPGTFTQSSNLNNSLAGGYSAFLHARATRFGYLFPATTRPSSGTITTSLFDFDSSLDKRIRAIKVDFDAATDGNGGSVDIAYQLNSVDGSFTTLQTGATAGTEYTLDQTCRSISVKVTLNKGTSTNGPVLKRIYVRAAPILQQFRKREYVLNLGNTYEQGMTLRDGSLHPLTGREQANNLITASQALSPFSITDRFGTFTGLIDLNDPQGIEIIEVHPSTDQPSKSGVFVARVTVREV